MKVVGPQVDRTAKMAGDDKAAAAAVPDARRGVVDLEEARVSRHLTERERAEKDTWLAWSALENARRTFIGRVREILTPEQMASVEDDAAAVGLAMQAVLEAGNRLLATDRTITEDVQRIAR